MSNLKEELQCVSYIQYLIQVSQHLMQALIDIISKINTIYPDFIRKLSFQV